MKIAVLGTGMVGNALATKLVQLGHQIMMGSRTANSEGGQEWLRSVGGIPLEVSSGLPTWMRIFPRRLAAPA